MKWPNVADMPMDACRAVLDVTKLERLFAAWCATRKDPEDQELRERMYAHIYVDDIPVTLPSEQAKRAKELPEHYRMPHSYTLAEDIATLAEKMVTSAPAGMPDSIHQAYFETLSLLATTAHQASMLNSLDGPALGYKWLLKGYITLVRGDVSSYIYLLQEKRAQATPE